MEVYIFKSIEGGEITLFLLFIGIRLLYKYLSYSPLHSTNKKPNPPQTNINQYIDNTYNPSILPHQSLKQHSLEPHNKAAIPIQAQKITPPKPTDTSNKKSYTTQHKLSSKKKALLAYELFKRKYGSF